MTSEGNKTAASEKTKLRVGIPRALLYYKYGSLWESFFRELGVMPVISPETNKDIVARGINCSVDESCLSVKICLGHVDWLKDKVDCLFIPNIVCLHPKEQLCVKFMGIVDIIRNTFPKLKVIEYTVDLEKAKTEAAGMIMLGTRITRNPLKAAIACFKAMSKYRREVEKKNGEQMAKMRESRGPGDVTILLVAHPYTTYDNFLGKPILKYLEKAGVNVIYGDRLDSAVSKKFSENIFKTLYWSYHKELLGAVEYYRKNADGMIFITTFPCGPDSLVMGLCKSRVTDVPNIMITLDELESGVGLETRLESFIDIIKMRKCQPKK